ncbi:MAG: hypothetical protein ACK4M9_21960 [Anaerobacillus sp.]|uniref:hypothetical protein n=1 Tax=Anaerobacillus sp. TaxID=1872506 RepID=UPI00391D57D2
MEEILNQILTKLVGLEKGQERLEMKQERLEMKQERFEMKQDSLDKRQVAVQNVLETITHEQAEMRKEIAFYYGSLMKKMDEDKKELSSEIKQITAIQKEHQSVLEYLNEKQ